MRDIRFRAWDKVTKSMFEVGSLDYYCDQTTADATLDRIDIQDRYGDKRVGVDIELMQFTGLRDKNGKEIYEGDIVITKGTTLSGKTWERKQAINFNPNYGYGLLKSELLSEVIGNIWEAPELLEAK